MPCGEGRLTLELASHGYQMTGADITPVLLGEARHKAAERQLKIAWEHHDMRDLPWNGEFDGAFCFWGSFGYFDDDGNRKFLEAVSRVLKPGAGFLIEVPNLAEAILPRFQERGWTQVGEILVLEERRYDHVHSRINVEWTFVLKGNMEKRVSSMRVYTYQEPCRLLAQAGLAKCEEYGSLDLQPWRLGQTLYLVATKAEA